MIQPMRESSAIQAKSMVGKKPEHSCLCEPSSIPPLTNNTKTRWPAGVGARDRIETRVQPHSSGIHMTLMCCRRPNCLQPRYVSPQGSKKSVLGRGTLQLQQHPPDPLFFRIPRFSTSSLTPTRVLLFFFSTTYALTHHLLHQAHWRCFQVTGARSLHQSVFLSAFWHRAVSC